MTTLDSIASPDFYDAWYQLLARLVRVGRIVSPRDNPTYELLGVTLRVSEGLNNILVHPVRDLNYRFMVAEALWILEGCDDLEVIAQYNAKMRKYSDDGVKLFGAYGPRLMPQIPWVINKLKEQDTRQAVATIWRPNPPPSKDQCCTLCLQFIKRDNALNLIVTMRSSDVWLGLPYDFFTFSTILNTLAWRFSAEVGWIQFSLGSSHLYLNDQEKAKRVMQSQNLGYSMTSPQLESEIPEWLFRVLHDPMNSQVTDADFPWSTYGRILSSRRELAYGILTGTPL